jgi:hypothetical protein
MSAPRRWKETHDAPVGVRELLGAARAARALPPASFRENATKIAKLSAAPAAAATGVAVGLWVKVAAAAVIGLASAGTVVAVKHLTAEHATLASSSTGVASSPPVANASPVVLSSPPLMSESVTLPEALAPARPKNEAEPPPRVPARVSPATAAGGRRASAPEPPPSSSGSASTLSAEIGLLEVARGSLASDPTTTLAKVAEHRARFAAGGLSSERDLLELDALRRTGHTTEARARAQAWLERDPAGLHAARVRRILDSLE